MAVDTGDVRNALEEQLTTVETENSDLADGIRATVPESEAGAFFRTMRINGFDFSAKRLGDAIVAHIEAEEEEGLGALFG